MWTSPELGPLLIKGLARAACRALAKATTAIELEPSPPGRIMDENQCGITNHVSQMRSFRKNFNANRPLSIFL